MKKLLISGDTQIACYAVEDDGSARVLKAEPTLRATYSIPQKDGVLTVFEGKESSALLCFDRDLKETDRKPTGGALCHIYYEERTKTLYGSCYGNGEVMAVSVAQGKFGALRTDAMMGAGEPGTPRAHCSIPSPDGRFLLTAAIDQDRIYCSRIAADGSFSPNDAAPFCALPQGSGPRHLKFHPNGRILYAVTEYSNELFVLEYAAESGEMRLVQAVSTLVPDYDGKSFGSALLVTRDGRRLYAANRGADTIALFSAAADGTLTQTAQYPCGGHWPRHMEFTKDETMILAANERSGSVTLHKIAPETGALSVLAQIPFDRPGFAAEWD